MPIYEKETQPVDLIREGPCLPIIISLPKTLIDSLNQQGLPIPSQVEGTALIDTGASRSAVDFSVIEQLQIEPTGIIRLETAGGSIETNTHPARFSFPGFTGRVTGNLRTDGVAVGVDLSRQSINSIIGRDLLKSFILIYNGPRGRFSLAV